VFNIKDGRRRELVHGTERAERKHKACEGHVIDEAKVEA
jgi:hypothetical protein